MECHAERETAAYATAIMAAASAFILMAYRKVGIYWDFASHLLDSRSMLRPAFYHAATMPMELATTVTRAVYFEPFRAPLSSIVMLPFAAMPHFGIAIYLVFLLFLLAFAIAYFSKKTGIDQLVMLPLLVTPYVLFLLTLINGSEILTLSLLLVTLGLIAEGRREAGAMMALVALTKYTNLVFLPLLLLVGGRKRIAESVLLFAIVTAPWLLFNWMAFGNPLFSYTFSATIFGQSNSAVNPLLSVMAIAEALPVIMIWLAPALAVIILFRGKGGGIKKDKGDAKIREIAFWTLALGTAGWLLLSYKDSLLNMERFGYMIYLGAAIAIAASLKATAGKAGIGHKRREFLFALALAAIITMIAGYVLLVNANILQVKGTGYPAVLEAAGSIGQKGLAGCGIVSNGWVYLRFYGIDAYPPYNYNSTMESLPVVAFTDGIGTALSAIREGANSTLQRYAGFYIEIPQRASCG